MTRGPTGNETKPPRRPPARTFLDHESGATTVEFALISVPFLGLLFVIFQTCLSFLMQQGLQAAVQDAARQVLVGNAQNNGAVSSWQQFRDTYLCPASTSLLPSFVPCANVLVDVRPYTSFSSVSSSNLDASFVSSPQYNAGAACQIVVVRAAYPMPMFLPTFSFTGLGSNVNINTTGFTNYGGQLVQMLTATAVFRNEPYSTTGC